MSSSEKIIEIINQFREGKIGTPIEEHAAKIFAFRDEFIAYVNRCERSLEWLQAKVYNYGVWGFMERVKEAEEKGITFEEVESIRGKAMGQLIETALESLIAEGKIKRINKEFEE